MPAERAGIYLQQFIDNIFICDNFSCTRGSL